MLLNEKLMIEKLIICACYYIKTNNIKRVNQAHINALTHAWCLLFQLRYIVTMVELINITGF